MKVEQALEKIKEGESLKGIVLEDINNIQVSVRDALSFARSGIIIPEQNVYYDDDDIVYDEDIDEIEWSGEVVNLSWEEKVKLFRTQNFSNKEIEPITLDVSTDNKEINRWLRENRKKISKIIKPVIQSLFDAEKMIKE